MHAWSIWADFPLPKDIKISSLLFFLEMMTALFKDFYVTSLLYLHQNLFLFNPYVVIYFLKFNCSPVEMTLVHFIFLFDIFLRHWQSWALNFYFCISRWRYPGNRNEVIKPGVIILIETHFGQCVTYVQFLIQITIDAVWDDAEFYTCPSEFGLCRINIMK